MSLMVLKLDAQGTIVGHTVVPDRETLVLQAWPQDRYLIVPDDQEVMMERAHDATTGTARRVYRVQRKGTPA